ncbi:MAG: septation ring formation regulator EzrA [Bacilli bacterium]|nr:septation ring formation regulator EzrA [Bacilli bacterium]
MKNNITIIVVGAIVMVIIILVIINTLRKNKYKRYKNILSQLEISKNVVASIPISLELSKVEPIIKNDQLEEKYNEWQERLDIIKSERIPVIDDMLIDFDTFLEKRDYKTCDYRIPKIEIEIYKIKESSNCLISEIRDITLSDEKYRSIVIKLKTKYRALNSDYQKHKELYDEIQDAVYLQLENIEKRFLDFEKVMEKNDYTEVVHIVKALDAMIEHMTIVVSEVPDLVLMAKQLIPQRVREIENVYSEMVRGGYPLDYLNIDYNIKETNKNISTIMDKIRVLNLEDCMFELKTIIDYLDSLFVDFEKEKLSRKVFEEIESDFSNRIAKTNKIVEDMVAKLDNIKNTYDLKEEDVNFIIDQNKVLVVINDDYRKLLAKVENKSTPYSTLNKEVEELNVRLKNMSDDLNETVKSLGNMYDDEQRAHEELDEIQKFLKLSKDKMRAYKLPIVSDNYFVELSEANEAIGEVVRELSKKPMVIKTLNTRVDTARDLVLKLYNTTMDMVQTAKLAEACIVYGNRFRSAYSDVDNNLREAENNFYKGNYRRSLELALSAISVVDSKMFRKLMDMYAK